jgi:hypothetical protein
MPRYRSAGHEKGLGRTGERAWEDMRKGVKLDEGKS